jgi:hypothetical protein
MIPSLIETMTPDTNIPESVRLQLSKAGKKGIKTMTREARSRGGKKAWLTRLKKAREQENKTLESKTV